MRTEEPLIPKHGGYRGLRRLHGAPVPDQEPEEKGVIRQRVTSSPRIVYRRASAGPAPNAQDFDSAGGTGWLSSNRGVLGVGSKGLLFSMPARWALWPHPKETIL
jgi:hypothetical protein